jgi:hypothetical protein
MVFIKLQFIRISTLGLLKLILNSIRKITVSHYRAQYFIFINCHLSLNRRRNFDDGTLVKFKKRVILVWRSRCLDAHLEGLDPGVTLFIGLKV